MIIFDELLDDYVYLPFSKQSLTVLRTFAANGQSRTEQVNRTGWCLLCGVDGV